MPPKAPPVVLEPPLVCDIPAPLDPVVEACPPLVALLPVVLGATPLGRFGRPEEVGAAIAYLASNEAGYVTGQALRVNGGLYV